MKQEATCNCQHCSVPYKFDGTLFEKFSETTGRLWGQEVECPNCHQNTRIYLSVNTAPARRGPANSSKGIEQKLQGAGDIFLVVAVLGAVGGIFGGIAAWDELGPGAIVLILSGIGLLFQGWIIRLLFYALAEIIILLRSINQK